MKTIYKFDLPISDSVSIPMPVGAQVLSVGVQHGAPRIWAEVDDTAAFGPRRFIVHGTGHPVLQHGAFIGTIQLDQGRLVFHVYEAAE